MANALRKFWPTGVLFLIGLGFDLSPVRSDLVAYALWALAALWGLYASVPHIKRIRVGLKPPDAELREALGARDRWREHFEAKQSEIQNLNEVRKHQLEKIREVEQEFQRLRDRNEQLDQLNKNLQVERDQLSDLLQDTKRENKKLRAQPESAAREAGLPPNVATERRIAHCDFHINDLLRLAGRGFIIEGKDFVHCTIRGPGVISTFEDVRPPEQKPENTFLGTGYEPRTLTVKGEPESVLHEIPSDSEGVSGVIYLVGCTFKNVTFEGIGIAGSPEEIKFWRENAKFEGRGSVGMVGSEARWEVVRDEDSDG